MKRKEKVNPAFDHFMYISPKQVYLSMRIQEYRRRYNMSQREMANMCTKYGEPKNIKFHFTEISNYENCKHIPTPAKFQILMNTLGMDANNF